ncbi:hypothetical protein N9C76_00290 [Candidatus Pelagibacter sp.]|nr:hypothetical protein [Candidatus Pelagibacter sp.]
MLKKTRLFFKLKIVLIIVLIILLFDFIYTNINKNLFSFDFENQNSSIYGIFRKDIKEYYISPIYGKTLFCTDQNGFRSNCKESGKKYFDYLLIGNIFTEGVNLNYEQTFAGIIEENNKNHTFANLGNRSLNINGIEKKITNIINNDYVNFNEVIIFIGPRFFQTDSNVKIIEKPYSVIFIKKSIMNNFYLFNNLYHWLLYKINKTKIWAYSKNNHYTNKININKKFINTLNSIHRKINDKNKKLSIVMYPYPYHFLYENYDTQFIKDIRDFCNLKCNSFINTYDIFHSKMISKDPWQFIDEIYLSYSVHFNKNGNKIIADSVTGFLK